MNFNLDKNQQELWNRITSVEFDAMDVEFTFVERLARDNGWSNIFAERVLEEYRRFSLIAALGLIEVTPSDAVDQAWHLHLLYTRHYWGPWCEALGTKLHHGPTRGTVEDRSRFDTNYVATLAQYLSLFGHEPPEDIWPDRFERFRDPGRFIRIDTSKYIIFNRPWA